VIGLLSALRGTRVALTGQTWRVPAIIMVGGMASYLAVNGLTLVASRGPLVIGHVAAATFAIAIGALQFLANLRSRLPQWHRWLGRTYVGISLFAGITAMFLASARGMAALDAGVLGLAVTAFLWIIATTAGFWAISRRSFAVHRRWMIRSYALAFTAITVRFYEHGMADLGFGDPAQAGAVLTWAALISNLAIAEWIGRTLPRQP
jgi:hypothetical protein